MFVVQYDSKYVCNVMLTDILIYIIVQKLLFLLSVLD